METGREALAGELLVRDRLFTRQFGFVMGGTVTAWTAHTTAVVMFSSFLVHQGFSAGMGGLMLGIVSVSALVSRLVVGPRIDRRDGRLTAVTGSALIGLGMLAYLAASLAAREAVIGLLIVGAGAVAHGAGFGAVSTSAFTLIDDAAPTSRRGEAVGYYGATPAIIQGLAATGGFVLVDAGGFGLLFGVVVGSAACAVLVFLAVRPTRARHVEHVPVARSLGMYRGIVAPVLASGLLTIVSSALVLTIPLIGIASGIANPGVFYLASAVAGVSGRLVSGRVSDRVGRLRVAVPGLLLLTVSLVAMLAQSDMSVLLFIVGGALSGLAFAAAVPALQALILDRSAAGHRGTSAAAMGMALDVGFASGSMLTGLMVGIADARTALLLATIAPIVSIGLLAVDTRRRATAG